MDEREELLRRDREKEKRREQRRLQREKELKKRMLAGAGMLAALIVVLTISIAVGMHFSQKAKEKAAKEKAEQERLALEQEQEDHTIELLAVGDNIAHETIRETGMREDGTWNYDDVYQYVKEDVEAADLALVTQETIFVEDREDVSGYPSFGTPPEFGEALVNTGFDVIASATNHALDKGTDSIEYTLYWWKQNYPDISVLGLYDSQETSEEIPVISCKELKLAILDYTYGLNGLELPRGKEYMVDVYDEEQAREDIRQAKELADVVVVVMHVGVEYDQDVDEETRDWTDVFLEEGVDIVIGSHPHVVRTMETLTGEDGHKMLVYYSLGNFTSTQTDLPSLMGAMAKITVRKNIETGQIEIPEHEFIPLLMYYNKEIPEAAVYKLEEYPQELIEDHFVYQDNPDEFSLEYYRKLFEETKAKGNDEEI